MLTTLNPDLMRRNPGTRDPGAQSATEAAGDQRQGSDTLAGGIFFDRVDRLSYAAPPTSGLQLLIFTVPQNIKRGLITGLGIGCLQYDFFGTNEYFFLISSSVPQDLQLSGSGGPAGGTQTTFPFVPIGTLVHPSAVRIAIQANNQWMLGIRPQATPNANQVVYNPTVRTRGFYWE